MDTETSQPAESEFKPDRNIDYASDVLLSVTKVQIEELFRLELPGNLTDFSANAAEVCLAYSERVCAHSLEEASRVHVLNFRDMQTHGVGSSLQRSASWSVDCQVFRLLR